MLHNMKNQKPVPLIPEDVVLVLLIGNFELNMFLSLG